MSQRRPSPPVCAACCRLHVRLSRAERLERRQHLVRRVEWEDPVTRLYVEQLFDHLTLGTKVWRRDQEGQLHPTPPVPRTWVAEELAQADRLVIETAFSLTP